MQADCERTINGYSKVVANSGYYQGVLDQKHTELLVAQAENARQSAVQKQQHTEMYMDLALQHEGVRHHRFDQGQLQPTRPRTGCKRSAERCAPRCQLILQSN